MTAGYQFHAECLQKWFECRAAEGSAAGDSCPRCRSAWSHADQGNSTPVPAGTGAGTGGLESTGGAGTAEITPNGGDSSRETAADDAEGYLNLAQLQPGYVLGPARFLFFLPRACGFDAVGVTEDLGHTDSLLPSTQPILCAPNCPDSHAPVCHTCRTRTERDTSSYSEWLDVHVARRRDAQRQPTADTNE